MDIEKELKEKLLKLFEETDRRSDEQEALIQELRQRLSLAEKVCFEANGFLKSNGNPLVRIYLERLEDAVKKWDSGRQNNGAQYVVTEATERSLLPKYCPNCGRRLEKIMEVKRTIKTEVESFELGDVISFKLKDGEKVQAKAVKQTDEGMLFLTVDCLKNEYQMFKNPDGMGSMEINYFNSDLRHALNGEILDRFPDEIRSRMVGMRIGNTDTFDILRIPTEREIFGENPSGKEESDTVGQFKGMKNRRNRIAFQGSKTGTWVCYCLQNRVKNYASYFARDNGEGLVYYGSASYSIGVRPVFLLA